MDQPIILKKPLIKQLTPFSHNFLVNKLTISLIEIADKNQLKQIQCKIKKDCVEFNQLSVGSKAKTADQLHCSTMVLLL